MDTHVAHREKMPSIVWLKLWKSATLATVIYGIASPPLLSPTRKWRWQIVGFHISSGKRATACIDAKGAKQYWENKLWVITQKFHLFIYLFLGIFWLIISLKNTLKRDCGAFFLLQLAVETFQSAMQRAWSTDKLILPSLELWQLGGEIFSSSSNSVFFNLYRLCLIFKDMAEHLIRKNINWLWI